MNLLQSGYENLNMKGVLIGIDYAASIYNLIMHMQIICDHNSLQIAEIIIGFQDLIQRSKLVVIIIEFQSFYYILQYCLIKYFNTLTQVSQFAILQSNEKFHNLNTLTIYFSKWSLYNDEYFDKICASLLKLPKLKLFTIIVSDIGSDVNFKPLGDRFKAVIDEEWYNNQQW